MLGSSESTYLVPLRIPVVGQEWPGLCNPSVYNDDGTIRFILRNVNYILHNSIDPYRFWSSWGPIHYLTPEYDHTHLRTRNWICEYTKNRVDYNLINTSLQDKNPQWDFVGLEDARLVRWDGRLLAIGVRRDDNTTGMGRMEIMEITKDGKELSRTKIEVPWDSYCEKNWVPITDMPWHFMRTSNPVCIVKVNPNDLGKIMVAEKVIERDRIDVSDVPGIYNSSIQGETLFRGSSQVIPYKGNTHIAIIHTCELYFNEMERKVAKYLHHFILWDQDWNIIKISPSFSFNDHHVEFTNGLAYKDGMFYIPFAIQDNFSYMLETSGDNIDKLLDGKLDLPENFEFLPNASIFYNDYDGFDRAEKEARYCIDNKYFAEAYCRYWRMFERSAEFPISPEKRTLYMLMALRSVGWGVRDMQAGNIISILEEISPHDPEVLCEIARYFFYRGNIGMARAYLKRSKLLMDDDHTFKYILKDYFFELKSQIENECFETCDPDKLKEVERVL
jgi:hypothetical protein